MKKPIVTKSPPRGLQQQANVTLDRDDFAAQIYNKGYDVLHEKALPCPCKSQGLENRTTCRNCLGVGWIFINPTQTRMLAQNINQDTKYKDWSEFKLGTISVSAQHDDLLGYMDRITLLEAIMQHSEVVYFYKHNDQYRAQGTYNISNIVDCRLFVSDDKQLKDITNEVTFDKNIITLNKDYVGLDIQNHGIRATVLYEANPQFHVVDITRELMKTPRKADCEDAINRVYMPQLAIARRAHYILDASSENSLLDNSLS